MGETEKLNELNADRCIRWFVPVAMQDQAVIFNVRKQSVKTVQPESWTAVVKQFHFDTRWRMRDRRCPATLCASMLLSWSTVHRNILRSTQMRAKRKKKEKKRNQRQSSTGNGDHWKPLLTSLNWWKDCLSLKKQMSKRFKVTWQWRWCSSMLHCCHFQFWLVKLSCCWMKHHNAFSSFVMFYNHPYKHPFN